MKHSRYLLLLVFIFQLTHISTAQSVKVESVRNDFFAMQMVEDGALKLYFRLKPLDLKKNPVLMAYRGASSAAAAGSVSGVHKKLQYFSKGKDELENAVKSSPQDAEIRFLRLATQLNAPGFLGYSANISEDKELIINKMSLIESNDPNSYLYSRIAAFLLKTEILTPKEQQIVTQIKKKTGN
ncbi:MAG: hypothetical protein IPH45_11460 [Bacteroidales bacterium]|nr:hypothetical protein [Bacteroidales bacterium]